MLSLTDAFQNLYTYIISIAGVIALVGLIISGVLYLTSAGDPEKLSKAKKQILAVFFGIILLLSSYLILKTINPDLVEFDIPKLTPIVLHPLDKPPLETKVPQLLDRVKEIAEQIKEDTEKLETTAQKIKELTNNCACSNTQSLCVCSGGEANDSCQPIRCYTGPGFQPCQDEAEIKENQKRVIAWKDEIVYYKNRAIAEDQDLQDEIKKVLDEKILYYMESEIIEDDEEVKEYLKQEREKITIEKNLKKDLGAKLIELADWIKKIEPIASEMGTLPDQCLINVEWKCQASCEGECHDTETGCQPQECSGENPCPIEEIQDQFLLIQNLRPFIDQACDEILNIIEKIKEHKTITI